MLGSLVPTARAGLLALVLLGAVAGAGVALAVVRADEPADFGFGPTGGPLLVRAPEGMHPTDPAACAGCHAEVAREWVGSMHGRSFSDPVFQAELSETRDRHACVACHAPLASGEGDDAATRVGVACAACHVRDGAILAGAADTGRPAPHAITRAAGFGGVGFCGGCHDFAFPERAEGPGAPYEPGAPQQATVTEWLRSEHAEAGSDCVDCHMPEVARAGGVRGVSHALRSLEDPAFVARALRTRAQGTPRGDSIEVSVELVVEGAGHAVPTGDIFRELHVIAENTCGADDNVLMRHFAEASSPRGWVLRESFDGRIQPGETRRVVLRVPTCDGPTRYRVELHRLDRDVARRRGIGDGTTVVPMASGVVEERR